MHEDEELRKRVEATPVASNGRVLFSAGLKRDLMEYTKEDWARGRSQNSIAANPGLNGWTLNRWHQHERKARGGVGFVEVVAKKRGRPPKMSAMTPVAAFEVTCPSGFEVRVPPSAATAAERGGSLRAVAAPAASGCWCAHSVRAASECRPRPTVFISRREKGLMAAQMVRAP